MAQVMISETLSFILEPLSLLARSGSIGVQQYIHGVVGLALKMCINCYISYKCAQPFGWFLSVLVCLCVLYEKLFLDGVKWAKTLLK